MTPDAFIRKWSKATLKERSAAQEHFIDLCRLLGEKTPAEADPEGTRYTFEAGATKTGGGSGWADVWKRGCFAWEYKGKHKDLNAALKQLQQYALALENPPLLIVSDLDTFVIHTNFTNTVHEVHTLPLADLADPGKRRLLKWAFTEPERLRPGQTAEAVTAKAAGVFAELAHQLRKRGHDPQRVAHFVNKLLFCMFAEDIGVLPRELFTRLLAANLDHPERFTGMAHGLFTAMKDGGFFGVDTIPWFDGGLFADADVIPLEATEIRIAHKAALLDWSNIEPAIFGTFFERGLDPGKRSQLGAHYTDRGSILRIIEPVIERPLLAEWETVKETIQTQLEKADKAKSASASTKARHQAEAAFHEFLERLRTLRVLDPACGSGNFLYVALQTLKDLEHRVMLEVEALGLQRGFPAVGPEAVLGIEINPYAAELARVTVWINEGAAVRVSLVCFSKADDAATKVPHLDGQPVSEIYADLTARATDAIDATDLTQARPLKENAGIMFMGASKKGPLDIPGDLARQWLQLPLNPNGRPNSDVLRPLWNALDITRRPRDVWVIDFGTDRPEDEAALYQAPFEYAVEHVKPERVDNRDPVVCKNWWRFGRPRVDMRAALSKVKRYIATPAVAKHRLFIWLPATVLPDQQLLALARDDDTTFGILHSRFHELWALRMGTSLEDRPRYTPTTTFETFPFPEYPTPNLPATDYADDPCAQAIAEAARRLVQLRDNWLNPAEWVRRVPEVVPGYPDRLIPVDENAAKELKKRTFNLYNQRPTWLANAHKALDEAVAAAYGWPADLSDDEVSRRLLALNRERSA